MTEILFDYSHINLLLIIVDFSANVLARFGLKHPSRCLGLVLINCTGSAATVLETFKTKFITWKSDEVGQGAEDFLLYHKFGHVSWPSNDPNGRNFSLNVRLWITIKISRCKLFPPPHLSRSCRRLRQEFHQLRFCQQINFLPRNCTTQLEMGDTQNEKVLQFRIKLIFFHFINQCWWFVNFFLFLFFPPRKFSNQKFLFFFVVYFHALSVLCVNEKKYHKLPELMLCGRRYYMISLFCVLNVITHIHVTFCEWIQQLISLHTVEKWFAQNISIKK